jgi:hypothetical protein
MEDEKEDGEPPKTINVDDNMTVQQLKEAYSKEAEEGLTEV